MAALLAAWHACREESWVHPLIALAAFNLDFLCIHPFRDGNGRVSPLLCLLQSYQLGYEVGRYTSLERLIEQNKDRHYETLEQSSQGWHEDRHDPWPYINYLLSILKTAYREFAERVGETKAPRGAKRDQVLAGIERLVAQGGDFSISALEQSCPGVGRDMVRRVLREQQAWSSAKGEVLGHAGRRRGNYPQIGVIERVPRFAATRRLDAGSQAACRSLARLISPSPALAFVRIAASIVEANG